MKYSLAVDVVRQGKRLMQTPSVDDDFPRVMHDFQNSLAKASPEFLCDVRTPPRIVCLCGSTKFKDAYIKANKDETLKGNIVLSVGLFGHVDGLDMLSESKVKLDKLHLHKIAMSDEILVLNVNGYVGESTLNEMAFAKQKDITIRYLVEPE